MPRPDAASGRPAPAPRPDIATLRKELASLRPEPVAPRPDVAKARADAATPRPEGAIGSALRIAKFCPRCHRTVHDGSSLFCAFDGATLRSTRRIDEIRVRSGALRGWLIDGRYRIRGKIGHGGMAAVYLAEDERTGEPVAVKILDRALTKDPNARERFLREVDIAAMIAHPNVVKILDAGELPQGPPFIVLEFLFGESLGDLLRRDGGVDAPFGLSLALATASALSAAHDAGIVHRDVKPDNLFLVGERGVPYGIKVMDFGMAKLRESPQTAAGMALGTLPYMPPEQILTDPIDARADVYALGILMFRMFTGRLPFEAEDDAVLAAQQIFEDAPKPSSFAPGIDPALESVIATALRKDPDNRQDSMQAIAEDIERLLGKRDGPVKVLPLRRAPDVYRPQRAIARRSAQALHERLEKHHAQRA